MNKEYQTETWIKLRYDTTIYWRKIFFYLTMSFFNYFLFDLSYFLCKAVYEIYIALHSQ